MDQSDETYLGRVAYEGARRAVGGELLPGWEGLDDESRSAWENAGRVTQRVLAEREEAEQDAVDDRVESAESDQPDELHLDDAHREG